MKRLLCLMLALAALMLAGCQKEHQGNISDTSGISRDTEISSLNFPIQYIRTDRLMDNGTEYPVVTRIPTNNLLGQYTSELQNVYDFNSAWVSVNFYSAIYKYNVDFFKNHSLLMLVVYAPTGSSTPSVDDIKLNSDGSYTIEVIQFTDSKDTTPATESVWHIIIEVPDDSPLFDAEKINVKMKERVAR